MVAVHNYYLSVIVLYYHATPSQRSTNIKKNTLDHNNTHKKNLNIPLGDLAVPCGGAGGQMR